MITCDRQFPRVAEQTIKAFKQSYAKFAKSVDKSKKVKRDLKRVERRAHNLLKGASAGRCELPGDLVWYTQDEGLRSYEELKSRVSNWGLQGIVYRLIYVFYIKG